MRTQTILILNYENKTTAVKLHSGERACHVNTTVHKLTPQVRCLPVSQEGVWSDGQ